MQFRFAQGFRVDVLIVVVIGFEVVTVVVLEEVAELGVDDV
jgi:hypothetical protein